MAKRLPFLSINRIAWRSLYRAAVVALALVLAVETRFAFLALALFIAAIGYAYFTQVAERKALRVSLWSLPLVALIGFWAFPAHPAFFGGSAAFGVLAFALFFGAFFILAGLGDFLFKDRFLWYGIAHTVTLLAVFLVFPLLAAASLWWLFVFFFVLFWLFEEAFVFFGVETPRRVRAASAALTFLAVEISFLTGLLPLGALDAAAFLALLFFLLRDALVAHFEGALDRGFALRGLTVFVLFALIIFASAQWSI